MKYYLNLFALLCIVAVSLSCRAQSPNAITFVEHVKAAKYAEAHAMLAPDLKAKVGVAMLEMVAKQLTTQYGNWGAIMPGNVEQQGEHTSVVVNNDFEKAAVDLNIVLDKQQQVEGFTIKGVSPKAVSTKLPANVSESEASITTSGGTLKGTFTIPTAAYAPPVVVIIAGSGPTDRNGNSKMGLSPQTYQMLAHALAENGIASLRYDKRMLGGSDDFTKKSSETSFDDFVADAVNVIKALKADIRFSKVFVAGHSEGSLIGILAAQKEKVYGVISLAGVGRPLDDILLTQIEENGSKELKAQAQPILSAVKAQPKMPEVPQDLQMIFNDNLALFLHTLFKYDPAAEIKKLGMPVLIVNGNRDLQVPVSEAQLLAKARPRAKLVVIQNMNHVLKNAPEDKMGNMQTYSNSELPLSPELVPAIVSFIKPAK